MEVGNATPFEHGLALGLGPDRHPCLGIVVKATYKIPEQPGSPPEPAAEQHPILSGDEHYKGDVTGSVEFENDLAPFKVHTDIVLNGQAYAPGRPVPALDVMLRIGRYRKVLRVFGDRRWHFPSRLVMVPVISDPEPFTSMPIRYERAFGGFDRQAAKWDPRNLIGRGFIGRKSRDSVNEQLLPNVEDPYHLISSWDDEPAPAGFGFISRAWQPRVGLGGSEAGAQSPHPLFGVAADFDPAFYNGAHPDLQAPGYLRGGEEVELLNMSPKGPLRFALPAVQLQMMMIVDGPEGVRSHDLVPNLDTLVLMPDAGQFYLVWRAAYKLGDLPDMEALEHALDAIRHIDVRTT